MLIMRPVLLIAIVPILFVLGACSSKDTASVPYPSADIRSFEVFYQRASLSVTEFEQFAYAAENIFVTCGSLHRGRSVHEFENFLSLSKEENTALLSFVAELLPELEKNASRLLEPGTGLSPLGPGKLYFRVLTDEGERSWTIAFDPISEPKKYVEKRLKRFVEELRATAGGVLCGNSDFYGIGFAS